MPNFKLYGPCDGCHKHRFFIRKRTIYLPPDKLMVRGRSLICGKCHRTLKKTLI